MYYIIIFVNFLKSFIPNVKAIENRYLNCLYKQSYKHIVLQFILVNSLPFSFIAMKRWKFQNHCDESDEIAMKLRKKEMIILIDPKGIKLKYLILYFKFYSHKLSAKAILIIYMTTLHFESILFQKSNHQLLDH